MLCEGRREGEKGVEMVQAGGGLNNRDEAGGGRDMEG